VSGPVELAPPRGVAVERVESTRQMKRCITARWARSDILIMAAAPADFRPAVRQRGKIKKQAVPALELVRNPDILDSLGKRKGGRYLVGFAAESSSLLARAREKLKRKQLDCIAANLVGGGQSAMGGDKTNVQLLFADGRKIKLAPGSKQAVARRLLVEIGKDLEARQDKGEYA